MSGQPFNGGFRSHLGRARGLGASHHGAGHWLSYRLLSAAYVPLVVWFVISVVRHAGADQAAVAEWLKSPINATLMLLTVGVTFHHAAYGMQEVFEDYVHGKMAKTVVIGATKALCLLLAVASGVAVLKLALGA